MPRSTPRWIATIALIAIVAFGAWVRAHLALGSPAFDRADDAGMLQSDPGLLYYLTERVVDAGGGVPNDWRADPRIEWPGTVDVPATFTVGAEFLVAWARRVSGGVLGEDEPLHVFCTRLMALVASLVFAGVYLLGRELGRSRLVGLTAAALAVLVPANYRTIGFVLMREDLSLPLFALHLGLAARAARVRTPAAYAACGLALGAAMATWHALGFVAALEAACFAVVFAWTGVNPLAARRAWIVPAMVALCALTVPALAAKHAVLSIPLQVAAALLVAARLPASFAGRHRLARRGAALAAFLLFALAQRLTATDDLAHVAEVLFAKLYYLGELPGDPRALSFDARMMWQGPFATLPLEGIARVFQVALALAAPFAVLRLRPRRAGHAGHGGDGGDGGRAADEAGSLVLALAVPLAVVATWLVGRMMVVGGIVLPVAAALALAEVARRMPRTGVFASVLALALQAWLFLGWSAAHELRWIPPARQAELAALVHALPEHVPGGEAVCADFMVSTAILAHTGHAIVLQPKWEWAETRARLELFWETFYRGTTEDLRRLLIERFDCRYLLVDRSMFVLRADARYLAGLPRDRRPLDPRTAAAMLTSSADDELNGIPGFELIWRSSPEPSPRGKPTDSFRLFRLTE